MFAKLKEGNPGYDVIVPSDYMVQTMISAGIIVPLDHAKLTNIGNLDPAFTNPNYDPGMAHSVPYKWGTVGIGYRMSKVETPTSWGDILDSDKYAGRIALLADERIVIGCALKYLGFSMNSTKESRSKRRATCLIKQKKNIKAFAPDEGQNMLVAGDADIVQEWNGDIIQVMHDDKDLTMSCRRRGPTSSSTISPSPRMRRIRRMPCLHQPHPRRAVEAEICNTIHYATPNRGRRKLLPPEDAEQQDDLSGRPMSSPRASSSATSGIP